MIRHMVLFNLRDDIGESDRKELFAKIEGMSAIPSIRRIRTGKLLDPSDPSYRSHMSTDFSWALLADFQDEDGLYAYQKDPMHVEVAGEIRKRVSSIKVIDFVTSD